MSTPAIPILPPGISLSNTPPTTSSVTLSPVSSPSLTIMSNRKCAPSAVVPSSPSSPPPPSSMQYPNNTNHPSNYPSPILQPRRIPVPFVPPINDMNNNNNHNQNHNNINSTMNTTTTTTTTGNMNQNTNTSNNNNNNNNNNIEIIPYDAPITLPTNRAITVALPVIITPQPIDPTITASNTTTASTTNNNNNNMMLMNNNTNITMNNMNYNPLQLNNGATSNPNNTNLNHSNQNQNNNNNIHYNNNGMNNINTATLTVPTTTTSTTTTGTNNSNSSPNSIRKTITSPLSIVKKLKRQSSSNIATNATTANTNTNTIGTTTILNDDEYDLLYTTDCVICTDKLLVCCLPTTTATATTTTTQQQQQQQQNQQQQQQHQYSDSNSIVRIKSCQHIFHTSCIINALNHNRRCPICRTIVGMNNNNNTNNNTNNTTSTNTTTTIVSLLQGTSPSGTMKIQLITIPCPGYKRITKTIQIEYDIPSGIQAEYHCNPTVQYTGTSRTAYIPHNKEGIELVVRLQYAFVCGLIFTIGTSLTTHQNNVTIWNSIHHKTTLNGGPYGYPDPNYITNCNDSLTAVGVPNYNQCISYILNYNTTTTTTTTTSGTNTTTTNTTMNTPTNYNNIKFDQLPMKLLYKAPKSLSLFDTKTTNNTNTNTNITNSILFHQLFDIIPIKQQHHQQQLQQQHQQLQQHQQQQYLNNNNNGGNYNISPPNSNRSINSKSSYQSHNNSSSNHNHNNNNNSTSLNDLIPLQPNLIAMQAAASASAANFNSNPILQQQQYQLQQQLQQQQQHYQSIMYQQAHMQQPQYQYPINNHNTNQQYHHQYHQRQPSVVLPPYVQQGRCPSGIMTIEYTKRICPGYENSNNNSNNNTNINHDTNNNINNNNNNNNSNHPNQHNSTTTNNSIRTNGTIEITYHIPAGIQLPYHQNPGEPYNETTRYTYIPNNIYGQALLKRLRYAWRRGLIFAIGTSITDKQPNRVVWANNIPHKTNISGNGGPYGYPDPDYITKCNIILDQLSIPAAEFCL